MHYKYNGSGRLGFRLGISLLLLFALLVQPVYAAAADNARVSVDLLGYTEGYSAVL